MTEKRKRGRPRGSHPVKVTPEFRENPDIKKMGLVFIAAAKQLLEQKKLEEGETKGDDMA